MSSHSNQKLSRRQLLKLMGLGAAGSMLPHWRLGSGLFSTAPASPTNLGAPALAAQTEGEIVIWDRAGDLFQVLDAAIPAFNQKYPNIKVNHQPVDTAKLAPTLAAGVNVPDGSFIEDENLGILHEQLYDLTDLMQPYVNDLVGYKVRVNTHDGKIKGIPYDVDPGMLFYRADILDKAGIKPESIETYDDLIAAAKQLKASNPNMKPIHVEHVPVLILLWVAMFANQQGTSYINEKGELQIESEPFLNIMNFIKKVLDEGVGNISEFASPGDVAACDNDIQVFYPWAIWFNYEVDALLKKSRGLWRVMPLPAWTPGGTRAASMGGSSFVIPAKAKNPQLAWLFYEYMMLSLDGIKAAFGPNKIYPGGISTVIPSYKPAYEIHLMENPQSLGGQDLYTFATGLVDQIPANYYFPTWYLQAADIVGANVQRLQDGQLSPEEVLKQTAEQIRTKLMR